MLTDYKFSEIVRDGKKTKIKMRVYEGDVTTEDEMNLGTGNMEPVKRYRRTKLLGEKQITLSGDKAEDFIRTKMNKELAKDTTRTSIPEQK